MRLPALPEWRALAAGVASRLDFQALLDQRGRLIKVETALPTLALIPERLVMRDAVGEPFTLEIECLSTSVRFELKLLVGEQISVFLLHADGSYKPWHGYVTEAAQLGSDGGLARYRLRASPWLSFLALRHDSFVWQDKTAREILDDLFKDYAQANLRWDVQQPMRTRSLCCQYDETDLDFVARLLAEEGLSYRFEHLESEAASDADGAGRARHVLVVSDHAAERPTLGDVRFATRHVTANLPGQKDSVTSFMTARTMGANTVTVGSWNYKQVAGTTGTDRSALDIGELPALERYDGSGAYRHEHAEHAERVALLALAALELGYKRFEGDGSARTFAAGAEFNLIDHPLYGANTTALDYPGALAASRSRPDNAFTLLAVEHHAANNLGGQAAQLLSLSEIESGGYLNHFVAAPAAAAVVPAFRRKPTAPGATTALVVGQESEPITTDREHRVKVQFHWQRGERPNAGGLDHASPVDTAGNAPGDERAGTWVRVALPAAGPNWGAAFVPRVGTEVAIGYVEGDIDRPVITGQLYNGSDLPPWSSGVDSGTNHPGTISGLHTHRLDGGGFNQWVIDDATGQLRMRLLADYAMSELGLGFLIQQSGTSAQRGAWRGSGFEATTRGWVGVRAGMGLLLSATARAGSYGSAASTQMDAAEALAQLKAARDLGVRVGDAAKASGAQPFTSFADGEAVSKLLDTIDPKKDGKHAGDVGGQSAMKASGREPRSDPVEAFAAPVMVFDTPSAAVFTSEAGIAFFAGQDASFVTQGDVQHTAARTWSAVSGKTSSWYTNAGGIKAYAANGPVSLRAHTDALQIWADQEVTVISVNDEITVSAQSKIELIAGQSSVTLEGGDIEFRTPGQFEAKGALKAFLGGNRSALTSKPLPDSRARIFHERFKAVDLASGEAVIDLPYRIVLADGLVLTGRTDAEGLTQQVATADPLAVSLYWESAGDVSFPDDASLEGC